MNERRPGGLGKGLGALIPSGPTPQHSSERPVDLLFRERGDGTDARPGPSALLPGSARLLHHPALRPVDKSGSVDRHGPAYPQTAADRPESGEPTGGDGTATESTPQRSTGLRELSVVPNPGAETSIPLAEVPGASFAVLPVDLIGPNPRQPRSVFDEDSLAELSESIKVVGVLQPVVVRHVEDRYELIMGERRWRATQAAGLSEIPAIIRETDDGDLLRDALVENLHRANLNPLEEAAAFDQLLTDFGCTHDELAGRLGCSRPHISNQLRLLKLPALVQRRVAAGVLSAGHARALLGLADQAAIERLAQRIVAEGLSVRATEEIVTLGASDETTGAARRPSGVSAHREALDQYATELSEHLETRVKVDLGRRRGKVTVDFADLDDLRRILAVMRVGAGN